MPLSHGRSLSFWMSTPSGGAMTSYSTSTKEVSGLPGEVDLGDTTVAGNVGHTSYPGLQKASFTSQHVFDSASTGTTIWGTVGAFQSLQQTYPSSPWFIQFGPKGTTTGYPEITCYAWIKSISLPIKVTDPNAFTINWEMSGGTSGVVIGTWT
jgi:hypothetical protein